MGFLNGVALVADPPEKWIGSTALFLLGLMEAVCLQASPFLTL
jgi:hypothetical protein